MATVAVIGVLTAFMAASIAMTQTDIKKVLAYSTISQLGYMFMAVGVGAFSAGIFHLMTHAFFKALLFLGAGSVIHGLDGEQELGKMGGLKRPMPGTHWTMLVGVLAISGIPGLSGFFSKDEILWGAFIWYDGVSWVWLMGIVTAGMTAFYMFRLYFLVFQGPARWQGDTQPHESPSVMTIPLTLLAYLAIFGGYAGIPEALGGVNRFHHFLAPAVISYHTAIEAAPQAHLLEVLLMVVSTVVALGGVYYAYRIYRAQPTLAEQLARRLGPLYRLSKNKYYVDEIYQAAVVRPFQQLAGLCWNWFDVRVVDGLVNASARSMVHLSGAVRQLQSGLIQHYASIILLGVIFIMLYITIG